MPPLSAQRSWLPPDSVPATKLPLAIATEQVLASMHAVLMKTAEQRAEILGEKSAGLTDVLQDDEALTEDEKKIKHLKSTKAGEVRVVRYVQELRHPPTLDGVTFKAKDVHLEEGKDAAKEINHELHERRKAEAGTGEGLSEPSRRTYETEQ